MIRYRLYTEDLNHVGRVVASMFDAATIYNDLLGLWKGTAEQSCVIELLLDDSPTTEMKVLSLAQRLKDTSGQESVLITKEPVEMCEV